MRKRPSCLAARWRSMRAISAGAQKANGGAGPAARFPSSDCRGGKVLAVIIQNVGSTTLFPIIRARIKPDAVVYSDSFQAYDVLDVSEFRHMRINHREQFADRGNHINGIENFWNQAKRHLRRYNGIPRAHFPLYLKECEWRFNHRPANRLLATLKTWLNENRSIPI